MSRVTRHWAITRRDFQFQATGVTNVTWTYTYTWSNSGTTASVNQSTTIAAGTATVAILDANGV